MSGGDKVEVEPPREGLALEGGRSEQTPKFPYCLLVTVQHVYMMLKLARLRRPLLPKTTSLSLMGITELCSVSSSSPPTRKLQPLLELPALRFTQIFGRNADVERGVGHSASRTPRPRLRELLIQRAFERLLDVLAQDGEELSSKDKESKSASTHGDREASPHLESVRRTSAGDEQARTRVLGDDEMGVGRLGIPAKALKAEWALSERGDALRKELADEGLRFGGDAVAGMFGFGARVGEGRRDVVGVL